MTVLNLCEEESARDYWVHDALSLLAAARAMKECR